MSREVWKKHPKFDGYQVSTHGRVRSFFRKIMLHKNGAFVGTKSVVDWSVSPSIMRPAPGGSGYPQVLLACGVQGKRTKRGFTIHRLVLETFVGFKPRGKECRHEDDVKTNNFLSNLSWGTPVQNAADKLRTGRHNRGERSGTAKLNPSKVLKIMSAIKRGAHQGKLAKRFSIGEAQISRIKHGLRWQHLTGVS